MVRNMALNGKLPLTSSVCSAASDSHESVPSSDKSAEKPTVSVTEKASRVEVASSDTQTDLLDQATEMTERKTLLIR